MAKQTINIGTTANDGTGDPLRTAFDKVNSNFTELYNDDAGDVNSIIAGDGISVDTATGNVTVTNTITNNNQLTNGAGYVDGSGTANYIPKWTDGDTIGNSVIYDNGTNVGIGTSSPATEFHVKGSGEIVRIEDSSATGSPYLSFYQSGARRSLIQHIDSGDALSLASEYGIIRFATASDGNEQERMRLHSTGDISFRDTSNNEAFYWDASTARLGLGTTSPTAKLQSYVISTVNVGATAAASLSLASDGTINTHNTIAFGKQPSNSYAPAYVGYITTDATGNSKGDIIFGARSVTTDSAPTERMRITSAGAIHLSQGTGNSYVGTNAGNLGTSTGTYNTANGVDALRSNTTGTQNTANGSYVLYSNTTGINNTANGYGSLYYNTTGTSNTSNGASSLANNTTGSNNTANGRDALYHNTTGNSNTANGVSALKNNTTGINNVANGTSALVNNTTGNSNTANGVNSLYYNTTGDNNTALGLSALQNNTTGIGNIAIGYNAGSALTTGSNNTIIGRVSATAGLSDTVIIAAGINERMRIDSSGNVGIGTTSIVAPLTVKTSGDGKIGVSSPTAAGGSGEGIGLISYNGNHTAIQPFYLRGSEFVFRDASSERMRIDSSGNVGIGTTSIRSGYKLDIYEAIDNGLNIQAGNEGSDVSLSVGSASTPDKFVIQAGGNVGIGTTSPSRKFVVSRDISSSVVGSFQSENNQAVITFVSGNTTSDTQVRLGADANDLLMYSGNTERMRITGNGQVWIDATEDAPATNNSTGITFRTGGFANFSRDSGVVAYFNRKGSDGTVIDIRNDAVSVGSISVSGSSTAYNTSSDYRLKEDWQPMANALDRVEALKPINFAWKVDGTRVDGFLAHELAEVIPEAVTGEKDATEEYEIPAVLDEEGNVIEEATTGVRDVYQGIDQSKIVPLLVAAIQELKAEIELLKTK